MIASAPWETASRASSGVRIPLRMIFSVVDCLRKGRVLCQVREELWIEPWAEVEIWSADLAVRASIRRRLRVGLVLGVEESLGGGGGGVG